MNTTNASMDGLMDLISDHRQIMDWYEQYKATSSIEVKRLMLENIIRTLSVHSNIEEMYCYPLLAKKVPNGKTYQERSIKEHQPIKDLLYELDMNIDSLQMGSGEVMSDKRVDISWFDSTLARCINFKLEHVKEEETEVFPLMRQYCTADELQQLHTDLEAGRKVAPHRPHPSAPAHAPFNKLVGAPTKLLDTARDFLSGRSNENL